MMKIFCSAVLLLFMLSSGAQQRPRSIYTETGVDVSIHPLTYDSILPSGRRGRHTTQITGFATGYFAFLLPKHDFQLKIGLGYVNNSFNVNREIFNSPFVLINNSQGHNDTFHLRQVNVINNYINIPLGIACRLAKGRNHVVEVYGGIQINNQFLVSANSRAHFDSSVYIPTVQQVRAAEERYNATSGRYVLSALLRLDMRIRISGGFGLTWQFQPYIFYINSSNRRLMKKANSVGTFIGLFQDF